MQIPNLNRINLNGPQFIPTLSIFSCVPRKGLKIGESYSKFSLCAPTFQQFPHALANFQTGFSRSTHDALNALSVLTNFSKSISNNI